MFNRICEILAKQLKVKKEEISRESKIHEDLGADSIDILQLLMTLEEEEGIIIPDEKLKNFKTVGNIADYLESLSK